MATGKRAGARRGAKARPQFNRTALGSAAAVTACLIAWGYLVYLAIDFGTAARGGDGAGWGFLALSALGAVACLFAALLLAARLMRSLGILAAPDEDGDSPAPPRSAPTTPSKARPTATLGSPAATPGPATGTHSRPGGRRGPRDSRDPGEEPTPRPPVGRRPGGRRAAR